MDDIPAVEEQFEADPPLPSSDGVPWGGIVGTVGIVLLVVFAVQNTETVAVDFLWLSSEFPLSIIILVTALASGLLAIVSASLYRRRRRARRAEKHELRQLRSDD